MIIDRRQFLTRAGVLSLLCSPAFTGLKSLAARSEKLPIARAFDREVEQFMSARKVPGAALAVVRHGKLVYAKGYGWADVKAKQPVRPDSLFRIASISKPFTATGIFKLVEAGRLDLEAPVFKLLGLEPLDATNKVDSRLEKVTVRHCLHHTGGWDRQASGDPMFRSREIAKAAGVPAPALPEAIVRYMLGQPLDSDPGTRFAYSNFGYCVLGRVIEKISGAKYEDFIRQEVLSPIGIHRMRLGASLEKDRAPSEVKYYTPGPRTGSSVFADQPGDVPLPYGTFCLEAMDSHGGWIASAVDLARFAAALDRTGGPGCLKRESLTPLFESPAPPVSRKADGSLEDHFYGCGWAVRPMGGDGKLNCWHNGSLPGTFTLLVRRFDGLIWAALFNQRAEGSKLRDDAMDPALHRAANAVAEWPEEDLFQKYQ